MIELISVLTTAIVADQDAVTVESARAEDGLTFTVRVAPEDMGRVIGKKGRLVSALRTVVRAAARETSVNIEITEAFPV